MWPYKASAAPPIPDLKSAARPRVGMFTDRLAVRLRVIRGRQLRRASRWTFVEATPGLSAVPTVSEAGVPPACGGKALRPVSRPAKNIPELIDRLNKSPRRLSIRALQEALSASMMAGPRWQRRPPELDRPPYGAAAGGRALGAQVNSRSGSRW